MPTTIDTFTEQVVVPAQVLPRGSVLRGTIDLTSKYGAFLFADVGRGGSAAISDPIQIQVRRVYGGASGTTIHPASAASRATTVVVLNNPTIAASSTVAADASIGATALTLASGTGFAAGDIVCVQDSGGGVTRLEWARVAKVVGAVLTLDAPLQFAHTAAQADTVRNLAEVFAFNWLPGGCLYEVVVDYAKATTGDNATVRVVAQIYAADATA